jgi:hypothetical protein
MTPKSYNTCLLGEHNSGHASEPAGEFERGNPVSGSNSSCHMCRVFSTAIILPGESDVIEFPAVAPPARLADDTSAISLELRDDRRDVVVLFLKTESPNTIHDCGQQSLAGQVPMLPKRFD